MKKNLQRNYLAIAIGASCVMAAIATEDSADRDCYSIGPDVVSRFWDSLSYGSVGDVAAFSFGTDACNIGNEVLDWVGDTADHPVISSAIYRLKNGRFEQVGVSWLKHGFAAAQSPNRCDCECDPPNDNQHLGIGCADAYSAVTNGQQGYQGPRSEVDAFLGLFPFPPSGWGEGGNEIFKRLQVHHSDLEPSSPTGVQYFGEIQYVSAHDSLYGNQFNNSTWQPITISGSGSNWHVSISGDDHVGEPVLHAWSESNPSVRLTENRPLGDGAILTAVLVSPVSDGWYRYEYAVQNVNAHRGVREVEIAIPLGGIVLEMGFHDIEYHSGAGIDSIDWTMSNEMDRIRWTTNSHEENAVGNAIRWGTTYNFWFVSNIPPSDGVITLQPFRNGYIKNEFVSTRAPNLNVDPCALAESPCPTDLTSNGFVDIADLLLLFDWWGDCGDGTYRPPADATGDCCVNIKDLLAVISDWGLNCGYGGSCCLVDGTCIMTNTQSDCDLADGVWNGSFTSCADVSCSDTGACCLADGQCQSSTTSTECTILGGTWHGTDSICLDVSCGVGADYCEDAPLISDGLHFVDTTNATTDGPNHLECKTSDNGVTGNDRWLQYVAATSGLLTVSTCEQAGGSADYDTDLVVYDGVDCGNLILLGCSDDTPEYECGSEAGGWHSHVVVPVTQGSGYLIRIGGWTEGSVGTAELLIDLK